MKQYQDLVKHIIENGKVKKDRTGTGTISVFGYQMRFDLQQGFPLLTTKKTAFRLIAEELLWFLKGDTNIKYLVDKNVKIWDGDAFRNYKTRGGALQTQEEFIDAVKRSSIFASKFGDLGPVYGKQWRSWKTDMGTKDQIADVIQEIKTNPDSRRLLVVAYNPGDVDKMALPPCHAMFQFYVEDGKLSCQLYQRSGDVFLGVPFNIASYALLIHMIALECNLEVGEFIHTFGDAHIYLNHVEQCKELLKREPRELPTLKINKQRFDEYLFEDFVLEGYSPHGKLEGAVSVGN